MSLRGLPMRLRTQPVGALGRPPSVRCPLFLAFQSGKMDGEASFSLVFPWPCSMLCMVIAALEGQRPIL